MRWRFLLSNYLMAYDNFQFFEGLGYFGVFLFFLLKELQGLNFFAEFVWKMDSIFLPLVDEAGKFLFANKWNY